MAKRKVCWAYIDDDDSRRVRCPERTKKYSQFCKEHDEIYMIDFVKCSGEAHSNPFIDHCMICMPHWGEHELVVRKDSFMAVMFNARKKLAEYKGRMTRHGERYNDEQISKWLERRINEI